MRNVRVAYPLTWRVMDVLETIASTVWPARLHRATPYLMLLPAVLLVGVLVLGLVQMADASFRVLDTNTFLQSETYSLDNYRQATADWRRVIRLGLFLCPTLVMNLRAGAASHNPTSSLIGFSISVMAGSEPITGSDFIGEFLDAIDPT